MNRRKIKYLLLLSLLILMVSNASPSMAGFIKTLLGEDPEGDANPASVDILKVYIANNGTHFGFIIKCRGKPSPSITRAYVVWMDTKGDQNPDYCLVAEGISGLFEVKIIDGHIIIRYKAPIVVRVKGKSIYLMTTLENIDYPDGVKEIVGVIVTTHQVPFKKNSSKAENSSEVKNAPKLPGFFVKDRAPDSGRYEVYHDVVSEFPGITPLIFVPSILLCTYIIYKRKSRNNQQSVTPKNVNVAEKSSRVKMTGVNRGEK